MPVDHIYFALRHQTPGDLSSPSLPASVVAPADITVWQVSATTRTMGGQVVGQDYAGEVGEAALAPEVLRHRLALLAALGDLAVRPGQVDDAVQHFVERPDPGLHREVAELLGGSPSP